MRETVAEIAKRYKCTQYAIKTGIKQGRFPYIVLGGRYLLEVEEIDAIGKQGLVIATRRSASGGSLLVARPQPLFTQLRCAAARPSDAFSKHEFNPAAVNNRCRLFFASISEAGT